VPHRDSRLESDVYRHQRSGRRCRTSASPTRRPRTSTYLALHSTTNLLNAYTGAFCVVQVPVWAVLDYTETRTISRELLLVKVSILGPEYLDDQLAGGPSHEPRAAHRAHAEQTKLERETALARHFEESNRPHLHPRPTPSASASLSSPSSPSTTSPGVEGAKPLTPSEALRMRHQHLQSLHVLANQFGARIVDVSENSIILEMCGKTSRVEAFLSLVKPFGIIESARTGTFSPPFRVWLLRRPKTCLCIEVVVLTCLLFA
jgi:acetolactate synthase small subunit